MALTLGSLFTGYGGLDLAVNLVFEDSVTTWVSDIEPGPTKIIEQRFPGVPNLGDITQVDWTQVEPVDIIAGGSPCQDLSVAGARAGMGEGTRSGLWESMAKAISVLRPKLVVWENVRGALSAKAYCDMGWAEGLVDERTPSQRPAKEKDKPLRALGRVLGDLANLGYDAEWTTVRASDVGAPHRRERVFVVAYPHGERPQRWLESGFSSPEDTKPRSDRALLRTPCAAEAEGGPLHPEVARARNQTLRLTGQVLAATGNIPDVAGNVEVSWDDYAPAIHRWENILGRSAPEPTEPNPRTGKPRLSPRFVEWMMGLPDGWVSDIPISRTLQLRALGNGVVPQQAAQALHNLLGLRRNYEAD